jgi:alpha-1,3-rhamnosyltransferase
MAPLVSVSVTTYNSREYILETLESIYNQSYKEIELIISDDYSTDNTISVVENWVDTARVKNRFTRIELIKVPHNTGVSANCNRCFAAASSNWVKLISGDDILLPNCIEENMNFVREYPEAKIIFSQVKLYQDDFQQQNYIKTTPLDYPNNMMAPSLSAKDQYHLLLLSDRIHYTPSVFMNKQAILKVGGYDETDRLVEDYPMWLKLTNFGIQLYYFHKETVGYRVHSGATNNSGQNVLFKPSVINSYLIRKKHAHPYLPWLNVKMEQHVYWVSLGFKKTGFVKGTIFNKILYKTLTIYANPFVYLNALYKRIN